jgi:uncharacterized damage-inducible protein DinB
MVTSSSKQAFLDAYEREHAITMKVLRAFPADQVEIRPHPKAKTARELAWVFVLERGLATGVYHNAFKDGVPPGRKPQEAPASWDAILSGLEKAHKDLGDLVRSTPDGELNQTVKFFVGPKTLGDWTRMSFLWFILHDQIHHRGQFSVYLRMAGAKVPSIYGPSGDEPWT